MKYSVLAILIPALFAFTSAAAQKTKPAAQKDDGFHRCGTQQVMNQLLKQYPFLKKEREENRRRAWAQYQEQMQATRTARLQMNYTIPVVVHIVMSNPGLITDQQVQSQIDVLNADFRGLNADSTRIPAAFKPFFGKSNIQFCLAKRDIKGDATNGIVRVNSSVVSDPGLEDPVKFTCRGGSDAWDPSRYLNIWVGNMPSGFLGYSFLPSDPLSIVPLHERGFVNNYRFFGKGGTATAPFNLGRTATHEIGHFFDLLHIWGPDNCDGTASCGDDDYVSDTPLQSGCTFGAPAADIVITDNCSPNAPGIMWMNFMDYVDDMAMVMYTPGQFARMNAAVLGNGWMTQLTGSDACTPPVLLNRDVRVEGITGTSSCSNSASLLYSCSNFYRPSVTIRNVGTDVVQSLTIQARLGLNTPVTTNWTGTLAPQASTTLLLNPMSLNAGLNANLLIYTSNPNGAADQKTVNDTARLGGVVFPLGAAPLTEGFEPSTFPPANWQRINSNNDITWERTTAAAKSGRASMYINNFDYNANGPTDWMVSPLIPVKGKDSAFVTFQLAAATYSPPDLAGNPTDTLEILISADCGATYQSVYKKWGKELVTTGNTGVDTAFIPSSSTWRKDSVFLGDFSTALTDYIQVIFRNTTNYENNIYIDDISIFTRDVNPNLKRKGVMVTPNPFRDQFVVQHYPSPRNLEYMQVFNAAGQLVWQRRIALGQSGTTIGPNYAEVNLAGRQSGLYTLFLFYRDGTKKTFKLVKVN